ncbi:MAG TPA: DUF1489 domain-containing protein [Rhizomicrobium sp.]|jgi:hypothetical protein|nr:DUF1489 domain-containing protein [Rhizomicrobium sp.]
MLHLIKLCVGVDSLEELARWQAKRVAALKKRRAKPELVHVTRQTPKRAAELLDGGSLYWVIRGQVAARQRLVDIRPARAKDGMQRCGLVYEPKLVPTIRRAREPFQGWRYLDPKDAPPDVRTIQRAIGLPASLCTELAELGLL